MSGAGWAIVIAAAAVLVAGPLALALAGWIGRSAATTRPDAPPPWHWRLTRLSLLLYVLAFNLSFFVQEWFLVLPKAFTPGLRVTLFHNNHAWQGEHPLAKLFQGTGVAATMLTAAVCVWLLRRNAVRSTTARLFLIWMVYCGLYMALPQFVVGALSGGSDVGMAMDYLGLGIAAKTALALLALASVPWIASRLTRVLLELADDPAQIATRAARTRFVFRLATLPALVAVLPILAFRVPREWTEVVLPPLVVSWIGVVWMQAGAWRIEDAKARGAAVEAGLLRPLLAVLLLLAFFQCVLRPGIAFY